MGITEAHSRPATDSSGTKWMCIKHTVPDRLTEYCSASISVVASSMARDTSATLQRVVREWRAAASTAPTDCTQQRPSRVIYCLIAGVGFFLGAAQHIAQSMPALILSSPLNPWSSELTGVT